MNIRRINIVRLFCKITRSNLTPMNVVISRRYFIPIDGGTCVDERKSLDECTAYSPEESIMALIAYFDPSCRHLTSTSSLPSCPLSSAINQIAFGHLLHNSSELTFGQDWRGAHALPSQIISSNCVG